MNEAGSREAGEKLGLLAAMLKQCGGTSTFDTYICLLKVESLWDQDVAFSTKEGDHSS